MADDNNGALVVPGSVLGRAKWNLKPHPPFFSLPRQEFHVVVSLGPVRALSAS